MNWDKLRNADMNVRPTLQGSSNSVAEQLDEGFTSGFVEGTVSLPVDGKWLLQLYVGGPAYDRTVPSSQTWPTESVGIPDPTESI